MAIEVLPDSPTVGMSPRISFSHDLPKTDVVPVEQFITSHSSSIIDFDFCVFRESLDLESPSADELFFDGKILPIEIKKRLAPATRVEKPPPAPPWKAPPPPQLSRHPENPSKNITNSEPQEKQNLKSTSSFWRFKRSTSLNCGSGYARNLCPLPLLSRSNSTGSAASTKRPSNPNNQKQNSLRNQSSNSSQKPSHSGSSSKPPLKKNSYASYSKGVKFNPVLNVPPANLFGLGSVFSGGKDRSRKKF